MAYPNKMDEDFSFRLTFFQKLLNPPGTCLFRLVAIVTLILCIIFSIKEGKLHLVVSLFAVGLLFVSCLEMIFGFNTWRSRTDTLRFKENSIVVFSNNPERTAEAGPYSLLRLISGFMGTWIIRSLSGHFLIVPKNLFSETEFNERIGKQGGLSHRATVK